MTETMQNAIYLINEAVKEDKKGNYRASYDFYEEGSIILNKLRKNEKNPAMVKTIRRRLNDYMNRMDILKKHLDEEDEKAVARKGSPKKKKSGASGGDGEDDDADMKKIRSTLTGSIMTEKPNVRWEDVAGLAGAKEALQEAVTLPIKFPHLFTGNRKPWKGILLYGPPGTGKSFLAKAVATEVDSTFFSVSSSDLVSKWMGESERLVKELFRLARENKPAIVFIDEIDSLCGSRSEGDSEASRRIKTEILVQMNGVGIDMDGVLVLGATNVPWMLDSAVRRRFEKRIYIPLPDLAARAKMFELNVGATPSTLKPEDFRELGTLTDNYSGSDIATVVRDALMQPIRKVQKATHFKRVMAPSRKDPNVQKEYFTPCSPGDDLAEEMTWLSVGSDDLLEPELSIKDFENTLRKVRPSVNSDDIQQHIKFTEDFGQEG